MGDPVPAGQEKTTCDPCTGFSESSSAATGGSAARAAVESLANPTASSHQVNPADTKRTRAPRAPLSDGTSTRTGYQAGPSPSTAATVDQVAPLSRETCTSPCCSGVNVDPLCLVQNCRHNLERPPTSTTGGVRVSLVAVIHA